MLHNHPKRNFSEIHDLHTYSEKDSAAVEAVLKLLEGGVVADTVGIIT